MTVAPTVYHALLDTSAHVKMVSTLEMAISFVRTVGRALSLHNLENLSSEFPTRSHTNRVVQPQNTVRGLKFRIKDHCITVSM